ncbi:sensor histidine kinase [Nonomuraea pusilla]|uniref:histidine kinase n=1 Tax=Nonomuraea pusilla TaxID=46177 RepID=A0A1H7ICF7_9ACTN|nr:histidine kinase [Nonomuraea pusilla]SEK59542.1 Signal transduction histidine kinase [Nonomuraea pusilla]
MRLPPDARRLTGNVALAAAVGVVGVTSDLTINGAVPMALVPDVPWQGLWVQVAGAAALLARVRFPLAAALALVPLGYVEVPLATPFALYSLGAHRGDRRLLVAVAAAALLTMSHLWEAGSLAVALHLVSICGLVVVPATVLGLYADSRRRLAEALAERAERAEKEQRLLAEQARAEERTRLAREMHDVVTHHVSLMTLQAGALRTAAPDEEVRRAAEELRATGRRALDELREVVGVLHDRGPAELAPQPALVDVSRLVAASGLPVELAQDDGIEVSSTLGRTAYRVVQEGLTNARKHAPGAAVRVRLAQAGAVLLVSVTTTAADRRAGGGAGSLPPSSRTGLLGLRQRVELVGGAFHAGPTACGGFELTARLPAVTP